VKPTTWTSSASFHPACLPSQCRNSTSPRYRNSHRLRLLLCWSVAPRRCRWEFAIATIVIAGELSLGVLQGIALGVVLALLLLIYRTSHPHGAVVGQLPGTEAYRDVHRHPDALTFPGLLIWRAGGDLFFASIGHFNHGLKAALASSRPRVTHVLLDADSVNFIDTSAADALLISIQEFQNQGITFAFARVRDEVREQMRLSALKRLWARRTSLNGSPMACVRGNRVGAPMAVDS
jgi:MFS superfamily sulfate permease-like transporter